MRLERARERRGLRAMRGSSCFIPHRIGQKSPAKGSHDMAGLLKHGGGTVPQGWRMVPGTYKEIAG